MKVPGPDAETGEPLTVSAIVCVATGAPGALCAKLTGLGVAVSPVPEPEPPTCKVTGRFPDAEKLFALIKIVPVYVVFGARFAVTVFTNPTVKVLPLPTGEAVSQFVPLEVDIDPIVMLLTDPDEAVTVTV